MKTKGQDVMSDPSLIVFFVCNYVITAIYWSFCMSI